MWRQWKLSRKQRSLLPSIYVDDIKDVIRRSCCCCCCCFLLFTLFTKDWVVVSSMLAAPFPFTTMIYLLPQSVVHFCTTRRDKLNCTSASGVLKVNVQPVRNKCCTKITEGFNYPPYTNARTVFWHRPRLKRESTFRQLNILIGAICSMFNVTYTSRG